MSRHGAHRVWFRRSSAYVRGRLVAVVSVTGSLLVIASMLPASAATGSATPSSASAPVASATPAPSPSTVPRPSPLPPTTETYTRPDVTSAALAARLLTHRIEVTGLDAETTTTYVNPDGSMTSELHAAPIREQVNGGWQPVDTTLRAVTGGIAPKVVRLPVTFSSGGSTSPLADATTGSYRVRTGWQGTLPTPVVAGNTATYHNVQPGVDIVMTAGVMGYDLSIVLTQRPTSAVSFSLPLTVTGLSVDQAADGSLSYVDAAGKVALMSGEPRMWGALAVPGTSVPTKRAAVSSTLTQTGLGPVLAVTPSAAFLADPSVSYPVTIDPPAVLYVSNYTYVSSGDPSDTNNYDNTYNWNGTTGVTEVGDIAGDGVNRAFYQFDTSALAGAQISSAWLADYDFEGASCANHEVDVYAAANFGPANTWNNPPAQYQFVDAESDGQASAGCGGGWSTWGPDGGIKSMIQTWATNAADGTPNHQSASFELRAANESDTNAWRVYSATSIQITITYSGAVADPLVDSVQPCSSYCGNPDGVEIGSDPSTPIVTNSITPTLQAMSTVNAGGQITYSFDVQALDAYGNYVSDLGGGTASGGSGSWAAWTASASLGLADGYNYRYRAVASYAGNTSGLSDWTYFHVDTAPPPAPTITSDTWAKKTWAAATSGTFSFGDSETDVASYTWYVYGASGQLQTGQTSSSAAVTEPAGIYTMWVSAQDPAGNTSALSSFEFWIGNGSLDKPLDQSRTQASIPLASTVPSGRSYVTYFYYPGQPTDSSAFTAVPTGDVTIAGGASHPSWPMANNGNVQLNWNMAATMAAAHLPTDGLVQVEACFYASVGDTTLLCAAAHTVQLARSAFGSSYAAQPIGPGTVSLLTGDFSVTATDVSLPTYDGSLSLGRTATTLNPVAANSGPSGIFGPGWTANLPGATAGQADATLQDQTPNGYVLISHPDGSEDAYLWNPAVGIYTGIADAAASAATVTKGSSVFTLTEADGTQTFFTQVGGVWSASSVVESNGDATTFSRDSNGRLLALVAPAPAGITCTPSTAAITVGCRSLQFSYATTTTATGTTPGTFGDYAGRLQQITYAAYDPVSNDTPPCQTETAAPANMCTIVVAHYSYDSNGYLRQVSDPRLPSLVTGYTYTATAPVRLASVTPPGLNAWQLVYDTTTGRLNDVQRLDPTTGTNDQTTIVYGIPATCTGATPPCTLPMDTHGWQLNFDAATTATWNQVGDLPVTATAIFPADYVPSSFNPASLSFTDWPHAAFTYLDVGGRAVNTVAHAPSGWVIDATSYDTFGNITRHLTGGNLGQVFYSGSDSTAITDPYVRTLSTLAARADALSTFNTFSSDGTELLSTLGPTHLTTLTTGSQVEGRAHTVYCYDQGSPTGPCGTQTGPSGPYLLVTTTSVSTQDPTGTDHDTVTTETGYNALAGGDGSGWTLRQPTTITQVMASGTNLVTATRYNPLGQVIESRLPGAATAGGAGTDARTTRTTYYTATGSGQCVSAGFAGLVCTVGPAAQPTSGSKIPLTFYTYNRFDQPLTTTDTVADATNPAVTVTRTTTNTYDSSGRKTSEAVTATQSPTTPNVAANIGNPVPKAIYAYGAGTGLPTTITGTPVGSGQFAMPARTITTGYDAWGRVTTYTDATGATTTTTYDPDGRTHTVTTGTAALPNKDTETYIYNGAASGDDRGLVSSVQDNLAGTFAATYDDDGRAATLTYPGGLVATSGYDNAGDATSLAYTKGGTTWMSFTNTVNSHSQIASASNADGSITGYAYDNAGRLTTATTAASACTFTENYGFNADSDRTNYSSTITSGCTNFGIQTNTSSSHAYDEADRLTATGADAGVTYDDFGRQTTVPGAGGGTNPGTVAYYLNDQPAASSGGGNIDWYTLDPTGRRATRTYYDGDGFPSDTDHYTNPSSLSADWTTTDDGSWSVNVKGPTGSMLANVFFYPAYQTTPSAELLLPNLHGDVAAYTTATTTGIAGASSYDPYGQNLPGSIGGFNRYGWLGTDQRQTADLRLVFMGQRLYNPVTGRFLQTDPVPGGSANNYDYAKQDPINSQDLSGCQSCSNIRYAGPFVTLTVQTEADGQTLQWGVRLAPQYWDAGMGFYTNAITVNGRPLSLSSKAADASYLFHGSVGGRRGVSINPFRYHPFQKRGTYASRGKHYTMHRGDVVTMSIEGVFTNGEVETLLSANVTCTL